MPYYGKSGQWAWHESQKPNPLQQKLLAFSESENLSRIEGMDVAAFQADLGKGLYFESSIPTGYGLGSSGALCAAVYQRYCKKPKSDLMELKADFAQMESFFHGNSSGIDPLTSYADSMLFLKNGRVEKQKNTFENIGDYQLFLIDTEMPRSTSPLVAWFKNEMQNADFQFFIQKEMMQLSNYVLRSFLKKEAQHFYPALKALSEYQFAFLQKLIPQQYRAAWQQGLASDDFYMKICGAGGGGYLLVWVREGNQELLPEDWKILCI